jgi:hypothetical protein
MDPDVDIYLIDAQWAVLGVEYLQSFFGDGPTPLMKKHP